jgi:hypothetical protein
MHLTDISVAFDFQDYVHFYVSDPTIPWSRLFVTMEASKRQFSSGVIGDYSVSETTLEQVFISFAKPDQDQID